MIRRWILAGASLFAITLGQPSAWGAPQQPAQQPQQPPPQSAPQAQQEKQAYTMAEYNAYQAAANEKNPQQRIKLLDDFVAKWPNSSLLPYVYVLYYRTYYELKNFPQVIEYADRLLSLGDKVDLGSRLEALVARAQAFFLGSNQKALMTNEQLTRARQAAAEGLKTLEQWKKPENLPDQQYADQKKSLTVLFNSIAGIAASQLKDQKGAIESFKAALAADPKDAVTHFRMGIAHLQMEPPQHMEGFWALARAIALKVPDEAQVRSYLRNQLLRYQQSACDKLIEAQMNELISLAASSAEPPATYKIPSAAELQKVREGAVNFVDDLKAGGEQAKLVWLAMCGLEFPDVPVKVIEVAPGNASVMLKVFRGSTPEAMEAATQANMDVRIEGQPEAQRVQKGDYVRFTGTLVGYDQNPFMLHWEKAKVNPEDIPEAKAGPAKKQPTKRPAKRPAKKPPA